MKLKGRLRKLEEKANTAPGMWVTFILKRYEDPVEREKVKRQLLEEYIAADNVSPVGCIFLDELGSPELYGNRNAFISSSLSNPLEEIMEKIAQEARDPLEFSSI